MNYDGDLEICSNCNEAHPPGPGWCKRKPESQVCGEFLDKLIQQNTEQIKNVPSGPMPYQVLTDGEKAKALESEHLKCYMCQKDMKLLKSERKPEFYCAACHISAPVWGNDVRMSRRWEEDEILGNHPPANPGFRGRIKL